MLETLWSITMSTKVPDHEIPDICAFQSISFDRKRTSIDERRQLVRDLLSESGHCGRFERVCQVERSLDCTHFDASQRRLYRRATRRTSKARLFRWLFRTGMFKIFTCLTLSRKWNANTSYYSNCAAFFCFLSQSIENTTILYLFQLFKWVLLLLFKQHDIYVYAFFLLFFLFFIVSIMSWNVLLWFDFSFLFRLWETVHFT